MSEDGWVTVVCPKCEGVQVMRREDRCKLETDVCENCQRDEIVTLAQEK
jgi:predicted RNA-binding Zn-ribbon protein involved in translation (DUF1610 family)